MKKISLKGIKETLSEKELKNVMGGSDAIWYCWCHNHVGDWDCWASSSSACGGDSYCRGGWSCRTPPYV